MAKKEEMKAIPSEIEQKIESLTFYLESYLRSAKHTISYAIPAFVNEINRRISLGRWRFLSFQVRSQKFTALLPNN